MSKRSTGEYESRNGGRRRRVEYRRSDDEPASLAVATALAEYRGEDVTETNARVYDLVDPDALNALFADRNDGDSRPHGAVTFEANGATVVVGPETVEVY